MEYNIRELRLSFFNREYRMVYMENKYIELKKTLEDIEWIKGCIKSAKLMNKDHAELTATLKRKKKSIEIYTKT